MFIREFDTSIHVEDGIRFCSDTENNIMSELKSQFEGRNYKDTHVVKIDKILARSECRINLTGLDAASTICVKFSAFVNIISTGNILYPVEIKTKDPMIVGIYREEYPEYNSNHEIYASFINTPEITTIKIGQNIPIVVERSLYDYKMKNGAAVGKLLTHNNNHLPTYKILLPKKSSKTVTILQNNTITILISEIKKIKEKIKEQPAEIVSFFEKLYLPVNLSNTQSSSREELETSHFDLLEDISNLSDIRPSSRVVSDNISNKYSEFIWSRNSVSRTSSKVLLLPNNDINSTEAISETIDVVITNYLCDIYHYNRLIYNLTKVNGNKSAIKNNISIWKLVRSDAEQLLNVQHSATIGGKLKFDGLRFSTEIINAAKEHKSKFDWSTIQIAKNTDKINNECCTFVSSTTPLTPWNLNSHNNTLHKICEDRKIKLIIDLNAGVGLDSINLAYEFSDAKLIGVVTDLNVCELYKRNLAMIFNSYEVICGNIIDVINNSLSSSSSCDNSILLYVDSTSSLLSSNFNVIDIVKLIFDKQISNFVIIKIAADNDNQIKSIMQELTWKCQKYEIRDDSNEISYLLFAIESIQFNPPDFKSGEQFKYILSNNELKSRLEKLLQKFKIDLSMVLKMFDESKETTIKDIEIYQKLCQTIGTTYQNNFGKSRGIKRYNDIKQYIPNSVIGYMDIGAGDCEITADIAYKLGLKKFDAIGIDNTGQPSKRASKMITHYIVKPGEKLPLQNNKVNLITAFQSLHHFQDLQYKLEEIMRVSETNKSILVIREHDIGNQSILRPLVDIEHLLYMICFENMTWHQAIEEYYAYYRTQYEWDALLQKNGWKLINKIIRNRESMSNDPTNYYYAIYSNNCNT